eukprot:117980_1
MSKKERQKMTMDKLNEFKSLLSVVKHSNDTDEDHEEKESDGTKKGKIDNKTGIQFYSDSEEDEDEYDPNWMKSKLEFKKRPQDLDIYNVDDYETIYGNSTQDLTT